MLDVIQFIIGGVALVAYLFFFAVAYFVDRSRPPALFAEPVTRFVFVVPAHNEEEGISATVESLLGVDYPSHLYDVVVVADNCTDKTATVAQAAGARCLTRNDEQLRGKGYALRFAFSELLEEDYAALVVVDADSLVSNNFLQCLNHHLLQGRKVIQAYYGVSNPEASFLTYFFHVGNLIENKLFWKAKQLFSLPIILRGNGMCFSKEILIDHPWDAFSIVEDTEYGLGLIEKDIPIFFASDCTVDAYQPETLEQAAAQRVRWASGNSSFTKKRALELIQKGWHSRELKFVDFGLSLLAGSRPLLLLLNLLVIFLAWASGSVVLVSWSLVLLLLQFSYLSLGIILAGLSKQNVLKVLMAPFYLIWMCGIAILGLFGYRKNQWARTSRK